MSTNFSGLDILSKQEVIELAFNHKLKYKPELGLSKKIKFGIEIETLGTDFIRKMRENGNVYYYEYNPVHKPDDIYEKDKWILYREETLFDDNEHPIEPPYNKLDEMFDNGKITYAEYQDFTYSMYDGGEIASPILKDDLKSWKELKKIIKYMEKNIPNLKVNDSCSCHNHFDIGIFGGSPEMLYNFIILLAENELVLTRFYCGEYVNIRKHAHIFARPIKYLISQSLEQKIEMDSYHSIIDSVYLGRPTKKSYSFDFYHIYSGAYKYLSDTFENRIPNGTLSPTIIQNNIMLMGFLMEYISNGKYDVERGIYNLKSGGNIDPFYIADMLPGDEFKFDFLTQYYKDGKTSKSEKLVKSKRIFY